MGKKTLVIGASPKPWRFAHKAVRALVSAGHEVIALGKTEGSIDGIRIIHEWPKEVSDIHTVTVYLRKELQDMYNNLIITAKPERVIFNPGAENPQLAARLSKSGIEVTEHCTLVMLDAGDF